MDMNQSPLSRLKTNKTGVTRASSENRAAAEAARSKAVSSGSSVQNMKQPELKEGQIVKGEIIDHRYNEVKILLEPGKQVISAKLSGDIPLSIGQKARFQVTEDSSEQLVLKYIPEEEAPAETTIHKALSASGLPITERSKAIVSELLNERMPVDKQTLKTLIRLSVSNREAAPLTLVLMYKNNIPMTQANITQFEAYQSGTNHLLQDIKMIARSILDVIRQPQPDSSIVQQGLSAAVTLQTDRSNIAIPEQVRSDTVIPQPDRSDSVIHLPGQPVAASGQTDQSYPLQKSSQDMINQPVNITPDFNNPPANILQMNSRLIDILTDNSDQTNPSLKDLQLKQIFTREELSTEIINKLQMKADPRTAEVLSKLMDQLALTDPSLPKLSDLLGPNDRAYLLSYIADAPDKEGIKDRILQGTASLKETLTFLKESLNQIEKTPANTLLSSPEYSKLIEEAFLQRWTISPDKIAKKSSVTQFYDQLKTDLESLTSLTRSVNSTEELKQLQAPVRNLQDNLQFMKDLNEAFTFLQLPVQLKDRQAHADLYVMTRKKAISDKRESLSVLLHLDMTNLGPLNIHVQMKPGNQLQADFYLDDNEACRLIKENLPSLTAALQKKGYTFQAEIKSSYKSPDFGRDFIEQSSADHLIQRYTFDIRT